MLKAALVIMALVIGAVAALVAISMKMVELYMDQKKES